MGVNDGGQDLNTNYPVSVQYTIRKGDTLDTISRATGIPISILAKDNGIKNPNVIITGKTINLNYHPEPWEQINGEEISEYVPLEEQDMYFEEMDNATRERYETVAKDGAQKHKMWKG